MKMKLPTLVLAALLFAGLPLASANAYVGISVAIAPPVIPVYTQPYCPGPGYIWTPGYWDWDGYSYFWVPGVWVVAPRVGFLWTPGYWGYNNGLYVFNQGYWGPTVGFYGGINYGYGYGGHGYYGGRWDGNTFRYNTAVSRVNTNVVKNTYVDRSALKASTGSRAGFNGPGGAKTKPTARETAAAKAEHVAPTSTQRSRAEAAKNDPALHVKNNKGKPTAEAIRGLDRKTGQQTAGAGNKNRGDATRQNGNENRTGAARQAGENRAAGVKTKGRTATSNEHPAAKANRSAERSSPRAHKPEQMKHNGEARKVSSAPKATRHVQSAPHRPQAVRAPQPTKSRQAGPAPRGHGPAGQAPQEGKKKHKKPDGE